MNKRKPRCEMEEEQVLELRRRANAGNRKRKEARYAHITANASTDLLRLTKGTLVSDIRQRFGVSEKIANEAYAMMARASRLFSNPVRKA